MFYSYGKNTDLIKYFKHSTFILHILILINSTIFLVYIFVLSKENFPSYIPLQMYIKKFTQKDQIPSSIQQKTSVTFNK